MGPNAQLLHLGPSNTALGTPLRIISVGSWRLPQLYKVHFKDSQESSHGEGCQSLSSVWGWCLLLHGLLVRPIVCLVNHYINVILFVEFLWFSLPHHSWTMLSDMVLLKKWPWNMPLILNSCLYHFYHVGLVPLSSYVWSYFARLWTLGLPQNFPGYIRMCYAMVLSCKFSTWFMLWFPKFVHVFVDSFLLEFQCGCQFPTITWMWLPAKFTMARNVQPQALNPTITLIATFPSLLDPKYSPLKPHRIATCQKCIGHK